MLGLLNAALFDQGDLMRQIGSRYFNAAVHHSPIHVSLVPRKRLAFSKGNEVSVAVRHKMIERLLYVLHEQIRCRSSDINVVHYGLLELMALTPLYQTPRPHISNKFHDAIANVSSQRKTTVYTRNELIPIA